VRGELQGLLIGGNPSSLGPKEQDPSFEISHQIKESKLNEDGSFSYVFETCMKLNVNSAVKFKRLEMRLYEDSETKGAILNLTAHKADGTDRPV
jgi:hypothetical protein